MNMIMKKKRITLNLEEYEHDYEKEASQKSKSLHSDDEFNQEQK